MVATFEIFRAILLTLYSHIRPYDFGSSVKPLQQYDFIVVGTGAAGSVVAGRLAETNASVLVLESGPSAFQQPETVIPAAGPHIWISDQLKRFNASWNLHGSHKSTLSIGHVMGGGTTINGMVFLKGSREDFHNWAQLGNTGWDYDSIIKYFRRIENFNGIPMDGQGYFYGNHGPVGVSQRNQSSVYREPLEAAAKEMGYRFIDPANPDKIGFTQSNGNFKDGVRSSSSESYLRPLVERENLVVQTESTVTKILFDDQKKVRGVEYVCNGETKQVIATKEVIISAGAIVSPKLLMLSGVGPAKDLKKLGIPVVADLPGVGQNLKGHPSIHSMSWSSNMRNVPLFDETSIRENMKLYNDSKSGPWIETHMPTGEVIINVNDPIHPRWPDVLIAIMRTTDIDFQMHCFLGRPESSGSLKLKSANASDDPIIDLNFLSNPKDIVTLAKGLKFAHQLGNTKAFKKFFQLQYKSTIPEICKILKYKEFSDLYWECYVKFGTSPNSHPAGTCKMAPDSDVMGVVDNELRVRGVSGLRVADASIMPQVVSVNPTNSIMMIGEKAADMIRKHWALTVTEPSL